MNSKKPTRVTNREKGLYVRRDRASGLSVHIDRWANSGGWTVSAQWADPDGTWNSMRGVATKADAVEIADYWLDDAN